MTLPKVGDTVQHPDYGAATVERVFWRITYPGGGPSGVMCTVKLAQPFKDRREKTVERVEFIVPDQEQP